MPTGLSTATLLCIAIAFAYVGLLYIWRGSLPRDHPTTIKRRLLSTALCCSIAWLPTYWAAYVHQSPTPVTHLLGLRWAALPRAVFDALYLCATLFAGPLVYFVYTAESAPPPRSPPAPVRPHSGRPEGVGRGLAQANSECPTRGQDSIAHSSAAAAGPHGALLRRREAAGADPGAWMEGLKGAGMDGMGRLAAVDERAARCGDGSGGSGSGIGCGSGGHTDGDAREAAGGGCGTSGGTAGASTMRLMARLGEGAGDLRLWRNLVAAPVTEEFVFRACMIPLLKLEGMSNSRVVLLTPLFFGAAHLHHVIELVRHQRVRLGNALVKVSFQLVYTTVFGWLAAFLFLRTGHLAAPVAAHMFCNWAGVPPFGDLASHPRASLLLLTTVLGVGAFALSLQRITAPERYQ